MLAAVARGAEKVGDIALSVGVDSPTANKYLHVLRELRLVERETPLTDPDPLRSRRGTYRIADRFVAFHFRHVQPHVSLIEAGRGARVFEESIQPDLARLLAEAETEFLLEHLRSEAAELVDEEILEAGRHPGRIVRALARTASGKGVVALSEETLAEAGSAALEDELSDVRRALGPGLIELGYRGREDSAKPLAVRRLRGRGRP